MLQKGARFLTEEEEEDDDDINVTCYVNVWAYIFKYA